MPSPPPASASSSGTLRGCGGGARRLRERAVATQVGDPLRGAGTRGPRPRRAPHLRGTTPTTAAASALARGRRARRRSAAVRRGARAIEWPRRAACGTRAAERRLERSTQPAVITVLRARTSSNCTRAPARAGAARRRRRAARRAISGARRTRRAYFQSRTRDVEPAAALWAAGRPAQGGRGAQHDVGQARHLQRRRHEARRRSRSTRRRSRRSKRREQEAQAAAELAKWEEDFDSSAADRPKQFVKGETIQQGQAGGSSRGPPPARGTPSAAARSMFSAPADDVDGEDIDGAALDGTPLIRPNDSARAAAHLSAGAAQGRSRRGGAGGRSAGRPSEGEQAVADGAVHGGAQAGAGRPRHARRARLGARDLEPRREGDGSALGVRRDGRRHDQPVRRTRARR